MPITYPLPTLAATVTPAGIIAPTYAQIYQSLQASFQSIYGTDSYLDPDSQDGQLLAVFARAVADCNNAAIAVYNNFSPATALGAGLSSSIKLNGLHRLVPTHSTCTVTVGGQVGITIVSGIVSDENNANQWALPAAVTIPPAGSIDVTATCVGPGAVKAAAGSLTKIVTPTLGWQTATNAAEATPGMPVENDAQLRRRQSRAVGLPSTSNLSAVYSALLNLTGVGDVKIHENPTGAVDADGVPAHSIAIVIIGGDLDAIASLIASTKSEGCGTFGTIARETFDPNGIPIIVNFSRPLDVGVAVVVNVESTSAYSTATRDALVTAVEDYIDGLQIGQELFFNRLWSPALLTGTPFSGTYQVASMTANAATADIPVGYNERVLCTGVTVNLV